MVVFVHESSFHSLWIGFLAPTKDLVVEVDQMEKDTKLDVHFLLFYLQTVKFSYATVS